MKNDVHAKFQLLMEFFLTIISRVLTQQTLGVGETIFLNELFTLFIFREERFESLY